MEVETCDFNIEKACQYVSFVNKFGVTFSNAVSIFEAQSSKLDSLFSLKRGKRGVRALSFEISKMSTWAEVEWCSRRLHKVKSVWDVGPLKAGRRANSVSPPSTGGFIPAHTACCTAHSRMLSIWRRSVGEKKHYNAFQLDTMVQDQFRFDFARSRREWAGCFEGHSALASGPAHSVNVFQHDCG